MKKEIDKFLRDGGKIKQLPDEVAIDTRIKKNQTRYHFAKGEISLSLKSKPMSRKFTDNDLAVLPKNIQGVIRAKRYKSMKRRVREKEFLKQNRLERLTVI